MTADEPVELDLPPESEDADFPIDPEETAPLRDVEPITYFGTDFDVHGLVRRLKSDDIHIPSFDPATDQDGHLSGFQRRFVWKHSQMERFVESLLLGFPVPGIFLVQQRDKSLLVLDGQQRLRTLQKFYDDEFALDGVVDDLQTLKYSTLDDEQRRSLDNVFIHATVMKYSDTSAGANAVYSIFERLNAGGTNLHPHEIRVALYNGELVSFIRDLNTTASWRALYGGINPRLKDQELILRFIAFYVAAADYRRPLKSFLNTFLFNHRQMQGLDADVLTSSFRATCDVLSEGIGKPAFRTTNAINGALVDAVMVGVARRLGKGPIKNPVALRAAFDALVTDSTFLDAIARATADEERVRVRLGRATEAFAAV